MFDNIKYSLRLLKKNKLYSFISVFGLAVGIACCILIGLFVNSELSYDNFHPEKEKIYRINTIGSGFTAGITNLGIAPTLKKDYPEVKSFCRYLSLGNLVDVKSKNKQFNEQNIFLADSNFFNFFGFKLISGDKQNVLLRPQTAVLTKSMAKKYYGDDNPIGQIIKINKRDYEITGVASDCPDNTDIQFNAILSINSMLKPVEDEFYEDWFRVVTFAYIKFNTIPSIADFQNKLDQFSEKYVKPWGEANDTKQVDHYRIENIEEVHFDNKHDFDSPKGNKNYIYIFSSVAIFVLLIACINYINLTLAQSTSRSKEIGIKKTLGSGENNIKAQFLIETFLITLIGFFIGLLLIELLIPTFNKLTIKTFNFNDLLNINSTIYSIIFLITITILSGLYPAFVLSKFKPIDVLKGNSNNSKTSIGFTRKVLLTLQFIFSISMIICSIIVYNQMSFMKNKDLGFNKKGILAFRIPNDSVFTKKLDFIQQKFESNSIVEKTAFSSSLPGTGYGELMFRVEQNNEMEDAQLKLMSCDEDFFDLMSIKLIDGENFNSKLKSDSKKSFIINQAAVEKFGWQDNPIGKRMQWGLLPNGRAEHDGTVIGVVNDFHFQSLHNKIAPLAIQFTENKNIFIVKLNDEANIEKINQLKDFWQKELGDRISEPFFLDKNFNQQYLSEDRMLSVFNYFTLLSIILSTLGLFALTSFTIKQKTKEIGIRKVLGASVNNIIYLISKDFIILMIIGLILAAIPSYYFINEWLNGFSYRINISVIPVLIAATITFTLILLIVIYNILVISNNKPVDALKSE